MSPWLAWTSYSLGLGRSSRTASTAGPYPASGHYHKGRRYVSMATCLDTVTSGASGKRKNNQGFGDYVYYKKLNFVINDSDFVILGLDLLIESSDSVNK